jgi:hypothetical protein
VTSTRRTLVGHTTPSVGGMVLPSSVVTYPTRPYSPRVRLQATLEEPTRQSAVACRRPLRQPAPCDTACMCHPDMFVVLPAPDIPELLPDPDIFMLLPDPGISMEW